MRAFAAAAGVHLGALLTGRTRIERATKPVLMPLLAEYVLLRGGPRPLALALLFGCAGDTLLQAGGDVPFLLGMGAFAAGHLCYLAQFAKHGRPSRRLTAVYGTAWAGTLALLWPGLDAELRVPVALYSLLLTTMALGATRAGVRPAVGGALFLLSDTLIASRPQQQFWIMLTYLTAQYLLAEGVLHATETRAP
ncbi:lysoplasmalogenase [Streptoverticillium reticulum]|uniref:lysoplasmalogenase n=1 Tax=Streptomyces TaxID=1883 RepID=UPI0036BDAB77